MWDSGVSLAEYVSQNYDRETLRGMHVMELGAGVSGLPGIAAVLGGNFSVAKQYSTYVHYLQTRNPCACLVEGAMQIPVNGGTML